MNENNTDRLWMNENTDRIVFTNKHQVTYDSTTIQPISITSPEVADILSRP